MLVEVLQSARTTKLRITSVGGGVTGKGRNTRMFRGNKYRLEYAHTLCLYGNTSMAGNDRKGNTLRLLGAPTPPRTISSAAGLPGSFSTHAPLPARDLRGQQASLCGRPYRLARRTELS